MKKKWTMLMIIFMGLFALPLSAFAEKAKNPIDTIAEKLKFRFAVLEGMDFLFTPIGIFISLVMVAILVFLIIKVIIKLVKASTGKGTIKDKWFWIESGLTLFLVFFIFSGGFFDLLSGIYNWTSETDIVGTGTEAVKE